MRIQNLEFWGAALVIAVITAAYLFIVSNTAVPAASSLVGHGLGILGFILMLMTEILYSLRKRYQFARWGKLQNWLRFHIFTGLVGPFLVLLHSSWKFQGLAGILTLMTLIIVISGFVGRYFYTAIPRTPEGTVLEAVQVRKQITDNLAEILSFQEEHFPGHRLPSLSGSPGEPEAIPSEKILLELVQTARDPQLATRMRKLIERQASLQKQLSRLDRTRRFLAVWHTVHVPLGLSLFLVAFVHVFAALYYSTLLH